MPIGIGIVGAGTAARAAAPAFAAHPGIAIAAVAEPDEEARSAFAADYAVPGYPDLRSMLKGATVGAVYIASPTALHAEQVLEALGSGKHVIVEKPMATELADALLMAEAAESARLVLVVGHSHSFDPPVQRMRALIAEGRLGAVRMIHTWNFSDWVYRPRRPDELDPAQGGSVLFRQGAHQIDIIRLLGGGMVSTVRAHAFDFDRERSTIGAHVAMLSFEDGAAATAVYNGYGGLPGSELCGGVGEWGFPEPDARHRPKRTSAGEDELAAKRRRSRNQGDKSGAPFQPHFGLTVVSCERGDIRQSPHGLLVYGPDGFEELEIEESATPHDLLAREFHEAVTGLRPALHDGRWGVANLEVCDAALRSARSGETVRLLHQVAVPA